MPQYAWVKAGLSFTPYPLTFSQTTREVHTAYPNRINRRGAENTEVIPSLGAAK
jgi:hypothetical protein